MHRVPDRGEHGERISASEVGRYVYCARAWWLQRVQGYAPQNRAALERGSRRHEAHAQTVVAGEQRMRWVRRLGTVALVLIVALLVSMIRR